MSSDDFTVDLDKRYSAAMDSVNLIGRGKPIGVTDDEWRDTVRRNVEHLKIVVAKDDWDERDLSTLHSAIKTEIPKDE